MTENIQDSLPLRIACLVHTHFKALPTKSKPHVLADGSREWVPMTGIVVVKGMRITIIRLFLKKKKKISINKSLLSGENTSSESLHCIAVT